MGIRDRHLIDGEGLSDANAAEVLGAMDGILVPGGFGQRAFEGKIAAARYARENDVPYLGICLGLQAAADTEIWRQVWTREERINNASTPMFLVEARKCPLPQ